MRSLRCRPGQSCIASYSARVRCVRRVISTCTWLGRVSADHRHFGSGVAPNATLSLMNALPTSSRASSAAREASSEPGTRLHPRFARRRTPSVSTGCLLHQKRGRAPTRDQRRRHQPAGGRQVHPISADIGQHPSRPPVASSRWTTATSDKEVAAGPSLEPRVPPAECARSTRRRRLCRAVVAEVPHAPAVVEVVEQSWQAPASRVVHAAPEKVDDATIGSVVWASNSLRDANALGCGSLRDYL